MDFLLNIISEKVTVQELELIKNSLILLISLPIVSTLTGFLRHVIGTKTLNVYAPIVLTFAFYQMGYIATDVETSSNQLYLRGLVFGIILYFIVFISSAVFFSFIRKIRMHYIPKTSIVLIGVVISVVVAIIAGTALFERKGLVYLDVFSILMIVTLTETFVSSLSRKKFDDTTIVGLQTLATAIIAYSIISMDIVQKLITEQTILVIVVFLLINIYIGRFIGLRLTEYLRFKDLLLSKDLPGNVSNTKQTHKKQKKSTGSK